jgi:preprotein translocase subunit YajC
MSGWYFMMSRKEQRAEEKKEKTKRAKKRGKTEETITQAASKE